MFCHNCGNELPKVAKFCPKCGTEAKVKKIEKNTGMKSSNKVSKGYQGSPSDSLVQVTRRFKEMSKNKVLVALLACAIIIVGVQVFGGGNGSNSGDYSNYNDGDGDGISGYDDKHFIIHGSDFKDDDDDDDDDDYHYNYNHEEHMVNCTSCFGSGECNGCDGSGTDTVYVGGTSYLTHNCNYCNGSGKCRICGGDGKR